MPGTVATAALFRAKVLVLHDIDGAPRERTSALRRPFACGRRDEASNHDQNVHPQQRATHHAGSVPGGMGEQLQHR